MYKPTDEQQYLIDCFETGKSLKVEACAGSGKTSTLLMLARSTTKKCLYLAFNKAIKVEAESKFPAHVKCSTGHALAWSVGAQYKSRLRTPTPKALVEALGLPGVIDHVDPKQSVKSTQLAGALLRAVTRFCQSADERIGMKHVALFDVDDLKRAHFESLCEQYLQKAWQLMISLDSDFPVSHDLYLKRWVLTRPKLRHEVIFFDEAQDANPVLLGLIEDWRQQGAQVIYVGDRYQQIYSWRGAKNAMELIETEHVGHLTRSFRYGQTIADVAGAVLNRQRGADVDIKGHDIDSQLVEQMPSPDAILCRTNSMVISKLMLMLDQGKRCAVSGGVGKLLALIRGIRQLKNGQVVTRCDELKDFADWEEFEEFANSDFGQSYGSVLRLIEDHGFDSLLKAVDSVKKNKPEDVEVLISTAHKSKGLEFGRVQLANDFPCKYLGDEDLNPRWSEEEAHLLYVAITRAIDELHVEECDAVLEALYRLSDAPRVVVSAPDVEHLPPMVQDNVEDAPVNALSPAVYRALMAYAQKLGITPDEAVMSLIENQPQQLALFA